MSGMDSSVPSARRGGPDGRAPAARDDVHQHAPFEPWAVLRIAVAALGAALVWFRVYEPVPRISVVGLLALGFAVWPVLREGVANLLARRMTMELSMLIAIVAAAAIAEIFTALVVTLFVLVAEELEHLTIARGRRAIGDLVSFIPREARIRRHGETVMAPVDAVVIGDVVLVNPGEKLPVDGVVLAGHSSVDQSRITGESMPVETVVGGTVYAGSINHMGALEISVERVGRDTSYGQIIEAVEAAEHSRAPVQKLADRLAGYLVYFTALAAALTWLITRDIRDTISVIIVAGACGIAAGTPIAILGGIGRAARLGAIIKGGIHLETLGRIDTIVLDKTGTLTLGRPGVEQIAAAPGVDPLELLRLTAAAELRSEHPLARAVVEEARARGLTVPEPTAFDYTVARGITAKVEGRTVLVGNRSLLADAGIETPMRDHAIIGSDIVVAADGRFLGEIIVADALRPEAKAAMAALAGIGVRTMLFSGDTATVAASVGRELGIAEAVGEMLPQDKLARVRALVAERRVVGMVGDGVNDAPALTAASLGIAMGAGTDIAKDSADIILIGNDLLKLVETLRIARRTRAVIWQNFAGTLIVDAVGIVLAATGHLNPVFAAFIHVGSELLFLGNSARMLPRGEDASERVAAQPTTEGAA
ncbi:cation-translocating P-type ATPase [Bosea sp. 124]|uniref:heavy metal translocating P-type ATPase n=1 Tax=Bosea sp. 124 TaxID=2135642 RepID=UPI000D4D3635|nr:cation-translocating P-type ATPase [Bosea sp. 124]PTM43385.1 Cu+-exporting ATPase [Bosea sp. 124]